MQLYSPSGRAVRAPCPRPAPARQTRVAARGPDSPHGLSSVVTSPLQRAPNDYFTLSNIRTPRAIGAPETTTEGCHIEVTVSLSPTSSNDRICSVPCQAGFHATSTVVIHRFPSMRYLPVYANIDLSNAAPSASEEGTWRASASRTAIIRPSPVKMIYP